MKILFLGDSITDCGHCFTPDNLGNGYVKYIALSLQNALSSPDHTTTDINSPLGNAFFSSMPSIINGGADGFTFPRIMQKWKQNYQDTPWDAVVITGGINEVGYVMSMDLSEEQAAHYLDASMAALRELTTSFLSRNTKVILLEPFLFPVPDYRIRWVPCLSKIQSLIHSLGCSGHMLLISPQSALDELAREQGYAAVTIDGIHLTDLGNQCLAKLILPHLLSPDI